MEDKTTERTEKQQLDEKPKGVTIGDQIEGDHIQAQGSQGFVNRPSGPVIQHFGPVSYTTPKPHYGSGLRPVRIFVASPGDVMEERTRLVRVVEQFNRGTAKRLNLVLELIRWETHTTPNLGRPQQIILDQLGKEEWDIFIGVLWLRFGLPTAANDPTTGDPIASGTQEEFLFARQLRKKKGEGWPKIMFYRCGRSPDNMFHFDIDQFQKVDSFFKEFGPGRAHEGLFHQYMTVDEFEDNARQHIESVLWELNG